MIDKMGKEVINSRKIANASRWSACAEIMAKIVAPIVNVVLARLLNPAIFGVVASITIITSFADIFTDAGFQRYIIQHEFNNDSELEKYTNVAFWSNFTLSILIYAFIFLLRKKLAKLVGCPEAYQGIAIAALAVICTSFSSTTIARYRRSLEFKPLFFSRMISAFIPLVITVPLAAILRSYWAMVIGTLSQQIFLAVFLIVKSDWKPKLYYSFTILKRMISFSLWNLLESLSIWFAGQANVFIVANTLNTYYLGLYKTAMSTVNSYMAVITASVTPVLFSVLSRYQNEKELFDDTFHKFQKIISIIVLPMGAGLLLYREFAVYILLGSQWLEISFFLGIWAFMSSLTITYSNVASEVYRSRGMPKISFFLQIIYMCLYIPAIIFSVKMGFTELCIVSTLIRFIPIIMDQIALKHYFGISAFRSLKNTIPSIVSALIMGCIAICLQNVADSLVWNIISILICIFVYVTISLLFPSNRRVAQMIPLIGKYIKRGQ